MLVNVGVLLGVRVLDGVRVLLGVYVLLGVRVLLGVYVDVLVGRAQLVDAETPTPEVIGFCGPNPLTERIVNVTVP